MWLKRFRRRRLIYPERMRMVLKQIHKIVNIEVKVKDPPSSGGIRRRLTGRRSAIGGIRPSLDGINQEKGMAVSGDQQTSKSERIALITGYPDNHCLVTRFPDNRYETRLTQPKRAAHPFDETRNLIV